MYIAQLHELDAHHCERQSALFPSISQSIMIFISGNLYRNTVGVLECVSGINDNKRIMATKKFRSQLKVCIINYDYNGNKHKN